MYLRDITNHKSIKMKKLMKLISNAIKCTIAITLLYSCQNTGGVWLKDGDNSGKTYQFGNPEDLTNLEELAKAYSEKDTLSLFTFYNKEFLTQNRRRNTSRWMESMEKITMEPYKIIPLHLKDSDFKHVLAWSKEERIYKNGSYEMLDLMESFTLDDAGKVKGFKQWVAIDSVNFGQRMGGKFLGRQKGEYSGRPFVFSNRNETQIIEKLVDDYNNMRIEGMEKAFADTVTIDDYKGNKMTLDQKDFKSFFSPYKELDWKIISIVPIKIMGTDAASGVIVYGNETRVMRNGKKWQMDLMEIFYFDLDGKISSIVQFARP